MSLYHTLSLFPSRHHNVTPGACWGEQNQQVFLSHRGPILSHPFSNYKSLTLLFFSLSFSLSFSLCNCSLHLYLSLSFSLSHTQKALHYCATHCSPCPLAPSLLPAQLNLRQRWKRKITVLFPFLSPCVLIKGQQHPPFSLLLLCSPASPLLLLPSSLSSILLILFQFPWKLLFFSGKVRRVVAV